MKAIVTLRHAHVNCANTHIVCVLLRTQKAVQKRIVRNSPYGCATPQNLETRDQKAGTRLSIRLLPFA